MPRVPPHFKVRTSLMNHPKMVEVARDNDLLALYVRLGTMAIERFADRTDDSFVLHKAELLWATGRERASTARALLHRLCAASPVDAVEHAHSFTIHIPNLAEKQGFGKRNGTRSCTPLPLPLTPTSKPPNSPPSESLETRRERTGLSRRLKGKATVCDPGGKKAKPKEPKIGCPHVGGFTIEERAEIQKARGCSFLELNQAVSAVTRWADDGASRASRVKRTRRRWMIYLRDQDWPYEGSGNGKMSDKPYTPPPPEFPTPEGTRVEDLSEAELNQARKETAAVREKLPRHGQTRPGEDLTGNGSSRTEETI